MRRSFNALVASGLFAPPLTAPAQPASRLPVVGVLMSNAAGTTALDAFVRRLRELGRVDGKNIVIEVRYAAGKADAFPQLAAELVQLKADVLFASGPAAVRAARAASSVIPIVALDLETDPVAAGWARSLARPGGNITGVFLDLPGLAGKRLQLMKEAAPGVRRVGVLWDTTAGPAQWLAAKAAAPGLGLELRDMEFRDPDELGAVLKAGANAGIGAVVMLSSPNVSRHSQTLADFMMKHRLPAISPFRVFAQAGGLLSYGPNLPEYYARLASQVDKILKGAKPADLPIEQPTRFELVLNLQTAKALGLTIPQALLLRADEVLQ